MRTITTTCFLVFFALAALAQTSKLKFAETKKNFGFVKKGEKVVLQYEFTNTGNVPVIITDAKAECSCTTISWPKQPVLPGQKGIVAVTFDTTPTYDRQDRTVEVFTDGAKSPYKLRFKGVVLR